MTLRAPQRALLISASIASIVSFTVSPVSAAQTAGRSDRTDPHTYVVETTGNKASNGSFRITGRCLDEGNRTNKGGCGGEIAFSVSDAKIATPAMIAADSPHYRTASGITLVQAAAAATIYYKDWGQKDCSNLGCAAWKEEHKGRVYYNGSIAWKVSYSGYTGWHNCHYASSIGYSIVAKSCYENSDKTSLVYQRDKFEVHWLFKGVPLKNTIEQWGEFSGSGRIVFRWTDHSYTVTA